MAASACSPANTGVTSYAYHNVTAKFNAYFIAKEKLDEVLLEINNAHIHNFNKTLKVFAPIDTNVVNANEEKIADIIKKASIAIQRHKVSKWVDDSYILVGIARMLNREYEESIETLKYVNVNSKDDATKHLALINLVRTFTEYNELNNALAVIDYLNRQKLTKENKQKLYLNAAYFYQITNDPNNVIKYLSAAVELMPKGEEKAKIHYILAQLFQKVGLDAMAYENYQKVLKNQPPYEFSFYARLNIAQVTELSKGADVKKIRKYFEQLLKDGKNTEFRDKIYYEMAEFEMKQSNIDKAIPYYKSSIQESVNNPRQKSFAYHKLGVLYFDKLKEYPLAKAYYDSAASIMPQDEEIYPQVASRQAVLEEFIEQINTIEVNDSLLHLATLDSAQLDKIFIGEREKRIALQKQELKQRRKEERNKASLNQQNTFGAPSFQQTTASSNGKFYFYDPTTVASGRNEFKRVWGDRSLQDNWRTKQNVITQQQASTEDQNNIANVSQGDIAAPASEEAQLLQERNTFFANIPFSEEQKSTLNKEIEEAYFKLGNIYNFDLKEKNDAVVAYTTLLNRYPSTEHKPEVLYLLYIYHQETDPAKAKTYAKELTTKFPETIYAKLILNPNYQEESNLASAKVKLIYEDAYKAYNVNDFKTALSHIERGLQEYPENDYEDNLKLLEALIIGKTEGRNNYVYKLQQFISNYPESELLDFAKQLLASVDQLEKKQRAMNEIKYVPYFKQAHYFVLLYENNKAISTILPGEIEDFAKKFFPNENLNAGNLIFDEDHSMILLSEFKDKETAEAFYKKFNSDLSPVKNFSSLNFSNFIISKDNFQIFYQAKMPDSYNDFFKENYKLIP
ncbi:hypothetical protein GCM10011506_41010 [Marivirga lumbricoides]|uniref:Gliding motility protein n=2 Tax=Marivirga lumbricoides TaxID=1046115 RepID=A0ABQ1N1K3_9BACT|nr:hypothetical protein GCM10011506_41010 [Marivirga lumbricoides]